MEYVNRRNDRYFFFRGKTKTGKPKYFASKNETSDKGVRIESLPEEFEIFENPRNSTVTIRRRKQSQVIEAERNLVERLVLELSAHTFVRTIIDGDSIVVYTPGTYPARDAVRLAGIFGISTSRAAECIASTANYEAALRFTLVNKSDRLYKAERFWCRGSIEAWMGIGGPSPLEKLASKFAPHLGRDSYFDL